MKDNEKYNSNSREYIVKRKKSVLIFIASVYAFCIFFLLIRFGLIKIDDHKLLITLIGLMIFMENLISWGYMDHSKQFYKKMPVPCYNNIRVFTLKEKLLYPMPVIITGYFTFLPVLCLVLTFGGFYCSFKMVNRKYSNGEEWIN